jgi:hypothetical protein
VGVGVSACGSGVVSCSPARMCGGPVVNDSQSITTSVRDLDRCALTKRKNVERCPRDLEKREMDPRGLLMCTV